MPQGEIRARRNLPAPDQEKKKRIEQKWGKEKNIGRVDLLGRKILSVNMSQYDSLG